MKKAVATRIAQVLKDHWTKMPAEEMSWVIFQIDANIPLDKVVGLAEKWYAESGKIANAEEWVLKNT